MRVIVKNTGFDKEDDDMEIKAYCYKESTRKNQIVKAINIINGVQNYFFSG